MRCILCYMHGVWDMWGAWFVCSTWCVVVCGGVCGVCVMVCDVCDVCDLDDLCRVNVCSGRLESVT